MDSIALTDHFTSQELSKIYGLLEEYVIEHDHDYLGHGAKKARLERVVQLPYSKDNSPMPLTETKDYFSSGMLTFDYYKIKCVQYSI